MCNVSLVAVPMDIGHVQSQQTNRNVIVYRKIVGDVGETGQIYNKNY